MLKLRHVRFPTQWMNVFSKDKMFMTIIIIVSMKLLRTDFALSTSMIQEVMELQRKGASSFFGN